MLSYFRTKSITNSAKALAGNYILVSMYGGDNYYYECAKKLAEQCEKFDIPYDIVEIKKSKNEDWIDICRKKVSMYTKLLKKHKRPILWVDVDTILMKKPEFVEDSCDVGLFMRGFNSLNMFDFSKFSRRFEPGYLYLSYSDRTLDFLNHTQTLIRKQKDIKATDDYFLEEGFKSYGKGLRILTLSSEEIARNKNRVNPQTVYLHGDSGNVAEFKGKAVQHEKPSVSSSIKSIVFQEKAGEFAKKGIIGRAVEFYEYAYHEDKSSINVIEKLTKLYVARNESKKFKQLAEEIINADLNSQIAFYKTAIVELFEKDRFELAREVIKSASKLGDKPLQDFITSKSYRYGFNERAKNQGIDESRRTKMFWWEHPHPGNFGDILSPYIVEKLTNIPPKFVGRREGMLAVGSIIKWASENSCVWGAGTSTQNIELPANAKYHAVRGPYTREEVLRNGGECPEIYGDPAWLVPQIYNKPVKKNRRTGLILHYIHEDNDTKVDKDIRKISIRRVGFEQIESFIDEMRSCERIISTSLHGVILANAYNIPVMWATVTNTSGQIHGDGIKFRDYFKTINIDEFKKPVDLSELKSIDDTKLDPKDFWLPNTPIDTNLLLKAAPFYEDVLHEFQQNEV